MIQRKRQQLEKKTQQLKKIKDEIFILQRDILNNERNNSKNDLSIYISELLNTGAFVALPQLMELNLPENCTEIPDIYIMCKIDGRTFDKVHLTRCCFFLDEAFVDINNLRKYQDLNIYYYGSSNGSNVYEGQVMTDIDNLEDWLLTRIPEECIGGTEMLSRGGEKEPANIVGYYNYIYKIVYKSESIKDDISDLIKNLNI